MVYFNVSLGFFSVPGNDMVFLLLYTYSVGMRLQHALQLLAS
uniref:Uncharacterized protein n=1 Tax=Arundo donax TaxID=35708 RepID=A0A0A9HP65_ARUDO